MGEPSPGEELEMFWLKQELLTELQSIFYALEIGSQPNPPLAKFLAQPRRQRVALFRQSLAELSLEFEPLEESEL